MHAGMAMLQAHALRAMHHRSIWKPSAVMQCAVVRCPDMHAGLARRAGEAVAGQGRMVARVQAGVTLLQLHRYLAPRGLECSFAPGARS